MNRKRLEDWNSGTVDKIIRRHPNGFAGFVIQGERGRGKSMYAYKVMAKIYQQLNGLDEYEAYAMSLNHMIFSPSELISMVKNNLKNNYVTPVLCLDDATVHFNAYKFFVDLHEVILLKGMFDTIRTVLTGLLMTCPTRRSLLKFLKDYDDYKIDIKHAPGNAMDRFARCYQFNWYPDERKYRVIVPYQDRYSVYVPGSEEDVSSPYGAYMVKRKRYLQSINEKLEDMMQVRKKLKKS